jgi:hypothetical protein
MKNIIYSWMLFFCSLSLLTGCNEETFLSNSSLSDHQDPTGLVYAEVTNVREYSAVKTGVPVLNTDGLIANFEIVSGRSADGTILDATYMTAVSIANPTLNISLVLENGKSINIEGDIESIINEKNEIIFNQDNELIIDENLKLVLNDNGDTVFHVLDLDSPIAENNGQLATVVYNYTTKNSGTIQIADDNKFGIGNYYFTIKVNTSINDINYTTTFEDVFHLGVGPQLVTSLLYSPLAQNLVVGPNAKTSTPYLITGNPAVTFALSSDDDKLDINTDTGVITLESGYATTENDTIYPSVAVTSTISGETTTFQGEGFLMLVASNTPVTLPKKTNYFFYPTFQANNKLYGYSKETLDLGSITETKVWIQSGPAAMATAERPSDVTGIKSLFTNATAGTQEFHESFVTVNSQDLTRFRLGYDLSTVFYIKNQYVEYMPSGISPSDLEIFISTDYSGEDTSSTWTKINDQLTCQINKLDAPTFIGTPYPGDQKLKSGMSNQGQDTSKNADAKWVRCEFDLNSYKDVKTFALKFKFTSNFTKSEYPNGIKGVGSSRIGRYYISDVHFKASEE